MALPKAVTDYLTAQEAFNAEMGTELEGVEGDVTELYRQIDELNNSPGDVTPEDQARIDALLASAGSLRDRLKTVNEKTPPATPPTA